jgi:hypothetical protein
MANLQEEFSINQRIIKRSFCQQPLWNQDSKLNENKMGCYEIIG